MTADSSVQQLRDNVETALRDDLDEQWKDVLDQWAEVPSPRRKAVRTYVAGLRNRILKTLQDIDTADEMHRGLAIHYIEAKCHWTTLNIRIQQQTSENGRPEEHLLYRASCVSLILQHIEPFLRREQVERLTSALADPLDA